MFKAGLVLLHQQRNEIINMNDKIFKVNFSYKEATHKPKVSVCINGNERYYQCTDGGITQFGNTQKEAFNNLAKLR